MTILTEERIVFIFVLLAVPALVYAVEKLAKRKVFDRRIIILILVTMTWFYLDKVEVYYRNKLIKGVESLEQEVQYPQNPDAVSNFFFSWADKYFIKNKKIRDPESRMSVSPTSY